MATGNKTRRRARAKPRPGTAVDNADQEQRPSQLTQGDDQEKETGAQATQVSTTVLSGAATIDAELEHAGNGHDTLPPKMTMTLQTQQIRHAMAEIRQLYADRTAPVLSRQLTSLPMTVQEICFLIVLDKHKQRRVQAKND